jgi:Gram-negative bacterial TonB protein C-terminal
MTYRIGLLLAVCLLAILSSSSDTAGQAPTTYQPLRLCEALESVRPGEHLPVHVSGVYAVGPESQVLYDPDHLECPTSIQPATWVDFRKALDGPEGFDRILQRDRRVRAIFDGELYGPGRLGADDLSLPPQLALINRIRGRRYGHLNLFRTKLVVDKIVSFEAVPANTPWPAAEPNPSDDIARRLRHADLPLYPNLALRSGIAGTVLVQVTVENGNVVKAEAKSGDRILTESAVADVKTWQFEAGTNASFTAEFVYATERRRAADRAETRVEAQLPRFVRITAASVDW